MSIEILNSFFKTKNEVMNDIIKTGFWPTIYLAKPSPTVPLHWHDNDVHGYVFNGYAKFLDGETKQELIVGPGDKFIVTARTLHAECEADQDALMILALLEHNSPQQL